MSCEYEISLLPTPLPPPPAGLKMLFLHPEHYPARYQRLERWRPR